MAAPRAPYSAIEARPLLARLAVGLASGGAAWVVNHWSVALFMKGAALLILGPLFVLGAFVIAGPWAGLLAVLVGYADRFNFGVVPSFALLIYALEGLVVWRLLPRTRSVVLNVMLFWLVAGGVLDYLLYYRIGALGGGFVVAVYAKQLFNETLCAVLLETVLRLPVVARLVGFRREPAPLLRLARGRAVLLAMGPVIVIALVLERMAFTNQRTAQYAEHLATADAASGLVNLSMGAKLEELRLLTRRVEHALEGRSPDAMAARVASFHADHRAEYAGLLVADAAGKIMVTSPPRVPGGVAFDALLADRTVIFNATRQRMRATFAPLQQLPVSARDTVGVHVLPVAEAMRDADGRFVGLVAALVPLAELERMLGTLTVDSLAAVTLLDQRFRVLATTDTSMQALGQDRSAELDSLQQRAARSGGRIDYDPRIDSSRRARMGIDHRDAVFRLVPATGWYVLVEHPADLIYGRMVRPTLAIVVGTYLALLIIVLVVGIIGRRASAPLRAVHQTALDVAEGRYGTAEALKGLAESEVLEVRVLAERLGTLEESLRAQQAAALAQQQRYERQLLHAQKMEGLGRLAGGVAHDFNNLLTPIIGFAEIARAEVAPGSAVAQDLAHIRHAAQRAQEVARHLLAFGRAQVLEMRPHAVDEVVRAFLPLLRGAMRENIQIVVEGASARRVRADASQLQQVLMNLGINAADAMPAGGTLRIGTADVDAPLVPGGAPQACVEIRVSDTGHGMDAETASRAFEPFFTTKPLGKGTGLGLAMVYGIVNQHGGTVEVRSAVGEGTHFRLLFPAAAPDPAAEASLARRSGAHAALGARGAETVLVVEDEASVRTLVVTALSRAGFTVIDAGDAHAALRHASDTEQAIDLLLTDVVMPDIGGPALAERLLLERPGLRVLFMSGYSDEDISLALDAVPGATFLAKPFDIEALTRAVRGALDAPD